jgi:hypothetical protein
MVVGFTIAYAINAYKDSLIKGVRVMVFNTTFNNTSVISWQLVLLVEETRIPREIL